jgi:hypothetical protein
MTVEENAEPVVEAPVDPLAQWRHLPEGPRPDQWLTSQDVLPVRDGAEPAGDPGNEFMIRYAS